MSKAIKIGVGTVLTFGIGAALYKKFGKSAEGNSSPEAPIVISQHNPNSSSSYKDLENDGTHFV